MTNSLYFIFPDHLLNCPETFPHSEHTSASILTTAYWLFEYWFLILICSYWFLILISLLHLYISTTSDYIFILRCLVNSRHVASMKLRGCTISTLRSASLVIYTFYPPFLSLFFILSILHPSHSFYLLLFSPSFISFFFSPSFYLHFFYLFWRFAPVPPARSKPSAPQMGRL